MKTNAKTFRRLWAIVLTMLMIFNMTAFAASETENLAAKLYWTTDVENGNWADAESADAGAIFNITGFEPGSEVIRYLKVENPGGLAFSYDLNVVSDAVGELASVIDVYVKEDVAASASISDMTKIGTLADVINGDAISDGNILPEGVFANTAYTKEAVVAVALKMSDNVPSEFMNKSTGKFDFELNLTSFDAADKFETKFENTDKYLYRVGNANTVALGSLFKAIDGAEIDNVSVNIKSLDENTDVAGVYTANSTDWTLGTIKFSGTGPIEVTIDDDGYTNALSLKLEVVDATNVTQYSELKNKNSVLLNDITMSSGGSYYISNASLYGNGFTFDVTAGNYTARGYISGNYLVSLSNAHLDNVKIIGAVYTQYGATSSDNYNHATVYVDGNCTIKNSYISNCAAPVRVNDGNLEIVNTTLKGGNYANLDVRNGNIILDNVTTINQVNGNDVATDGTIVVGLGVVVFYEQVLNTTTIEIRNGITQYNHFSETQSKEYLLDDKTTTLTKVMFASTNSDMQYNDGTDVWVNPGIVSMCAEVGDANISDIEGYTGKTATLLGTDGYVLSKVPTAESIAATVPAYESTKQGTIAPIYSFEYPTAAGKKNYIAKTDGSNKACYYSGGEVLISFDEGDSVSFDTSILTVDKAGQTLPYTVKKDGVDCTGQVLNFTQSGTHTLTYTYTDSNNYGIDANGNITTYSQEYTKTVQLSVSSIKPEAKNASFNFGSTGLSTKTVTIGNDTYVMPDATATSDTVGSTTVSGTTVYCPIVNCAASNNKTSQTSGTTWYMLFPVFKNVVTITDYADSGTGNAVTYDSTTTTLPSGLAAYNPASTFKYAASADAPTTPSVYSSVLYYTSPAMEGVNRDAYTIYAKYTYQDNAGKTYCYYVCYKTPKITNSGCLTGDTKITLADGSTKRIDEITYEDELRVWNFFEGKYSTATSAIIFNHGTVDNYVIKLKFEDGTEVKVVNLHQFFDVEANEFVDVTVDTVASLVGRTFAKADGTDIKAIKLESYEISDENVGAYGIISSGNYNIIAEGMLTTDFEYQDKGLFNYFAIGENMTFKNVEEDVEKYGLYTYADFEGYLTPELFDAFNVKYMKVAVGKGQYTYDGIIGLIEKWLMGNDEVAPMSEEVQVINTPDTTESTVEKYEMVAPLTVNNGAVSPIAAIEAVAENGSSVPQTLTIKASGNSVTAGAYAVNVSGEGVEAGSDGYVIKNAECDVVITASGASTGYAKITIDEDTYYTQQIANGESFTLSMKNAVGKVVKVESFWGNSANYEVAQDTLIASGKVIEYTYTVAIEATNATETEEGYAVTADEAVFKLTANGSATPGYAKITVNGDDYYTVAIAKGETFTFTVKNANGKVVAIETFYGEPTAENLLANGSTIGYVTEVSATNATVNAEGKYVVNADDATIKVTASGTSTGYAKITVGSDVYYTNQIAAGDSFTLNLKNAKGEVVAVETVWGNSANNGIAQDSLIADGKVIEYTYTVAIEATNATAGEDGYAVTADEATFTLTANGSATPGYAKITVNGDDYYTVAIAKGETFTFTVKNANGKVVAIETFYGESTAENLLANGSIIGYVAEVTATNATVNAEGKYVVNANDATIKVTASGTSTGYAKITVGSDVYYTNQIAAGESFTLNLKNAKGEVVAVETVWGNSANDGIAQDALIADGKVIEYTYTVAIEATNATETEDGYAVTADEATFTLTANGSATPGYAKITVNGDDYYTVAIAKGETFTFTVKNANGKVVAIETFYGEPTAENLLANGSTIGYVAEVTATNATVNAEGKYVVNANDATIKVTASGTSTGYAKITVGSDVYYTNQIAAGESFTLNLKNAIDKIVAVETIWSNSANDGIAQDTLIADGKVIEFTYAIDVVTDAEKNGDVYLCLTNEVGFTFTANGTAEIGYATLKVDGDVYYAEVVPGTAVSVTIKNAAGKDVEVSTSYGRFDHGIVSEEFVLENNGVIDCGVFEVKSFEGVTVVLANTTKVASELCDIYVAVYDSLGRMTGIKSERGISVEGKNEHSFNAELTIPENGTAKAFVWKAGTMIPMF